MQIRGKVTYILRDAQTGEIKRQNTETNIINDSFYGLESIAPLIGISDINVTPDVRRRVIPRVLAFGTDISGVPTLTNGLNSPTPPLYVEYTQRFLPPAADRTINTIFLATEDTTSTTTGDHGDTKYWARTAGAYLSLSVPCTQTTTETLDVAYRLEFSDYGPSSNINDRIVKTTAQYLLQGVPVEYNPFLNIVHGNWQAGISPTQYQLLCTGLPDLESHENLSSGTTTTFDRFDYLYAIRYKFINPLAATSNVGKIVGTLIHGNESNTHYNCHAFWHDLKAPNQSPVQTTFGHTISSTTPFYQAATAATGAGKITINGDTWTNPDFPKMYRVEITTSGPVGTSEYKFKVRDVMGFKSNSYQDEAVSVPYFSNRFQNVQAIVDDVTVNLPWDEEFIDSSLPYGNGSLLNVKSSSILKLDIISKTAQKWDSSTTPALNATSISQVEVDQSTGEIWVSCRATGLYKISSNGTSITQFDPTNPAIFTGPALTNPCYGVDIGNGKVWAAFEGGIAVTSDNGTSWTVYDETTTPAIVQTTINSNWSTVQFLRADPSSANDEIAIVYDSGSQIPKFTWWDPVTGTAVDYPDRVMTNLSTAERIRRYSPIFTVSDTGSIWATTSHPDISGVPRFYTYGSTIGIDSTASTSNTDLRCAPVFLLDPSGDQALLCYSSDAAVYLAYPDGSVSTSFTVDSGNFGGGFDYLIAHIGRGKFATLPSNSTNLVISTVADIGDPSAGLLESLLWTEYGWDGSAWVEGGTGSKLTHATDDLLHDGLTISFDNNGGGFVATEYYNTGVVDGVWIDGTVEIENDHFLYTKPVVEGITDFEFSTLPVTPSTVQLNPGAAVSDYPFLNGWTDLINASTDLTYIRDSSGTGTVTGFPSQIRSRGRSVDSLQGDFYIPFHLYARSGTATMEGFIVGITDVSNLGAAFPGNDNHISHGIFLDVDDANTVNQLHVRESGVNVYTHPDPIELSFNVDNDKESFGMAIERVGNVINYYFLSELIYTSAVNSTNEVHLEVLLNELSGIRLSRGFTGGTPSPYPVISRNFTGNYLRMGNSIAQTGVFDPDFVRTGAFPVEYEINIDGAPATIIFQDYTTPLAAGEVSILIESGVLRYSDADAGKTITGRFNYLKNPSS